MDLLHLVLASCVSNRQRSAAVWSGSRTGVQHRADSATPQSDPCLIISVFDPTTIKWRWIYYHSVRCTWPDKRKNNSKYQIMMHSIQLLLTNAIRHIIAPCSIARSHYIWPYLIWLVTSYLNRLTLHLLRNFLMSPAWDHKSTWALLQMPLPIYMIAPRQNRIQDTQKKIMVSQSSLSSLSQAERNTHLDLFSFSTNFSIPMPSNMLDQVQKVIQKIICLSSSDKTLSKGQVIQQTHTEQAEMWYNNFSYSPCCLVNQNYIMCICLHDNPANRSAYNWQTYNLHKFEQNEIKYRLFKL